ncbi:unnamed protein product [Calypogeia fissa]
MFIRARSYPGDLCQLSHQNTFFTDRDLPKHGKTSDTHGFCVPPKLVRRFEASGCHDRQHFEDKRRLSSSPALNSLTKPKSATLTRSRRDTLTSKGSPNHPLQVGLIPPTLIYTERLRKGFDISTISQENKLQRDEILQISRKLVVRERKDEPESNGCEDARFSATDSFIRRQEGNTDPLSTSLADPLEVGSSQLSSMERIESREGTRLRKIWKRKKERRRMGSLILLNVLAALYGSSNVANGIVADMAPSLPVSLTSLVRFTSALFFFTPALATALKNRDLELLRAGSELGGLAFVATVVDSCNPSSGSSSSAALLFAFTVIFIPIMEIFAGRRSGSTLTRFATLAAVSGMGLLEEEGFGWRGISCPQIGDLWGMAVSIIYAIHIFRSEYHSSRFDPLLLNAVQCGVLAILSLGWETFTTFDVTAFQAHDVVNQVQSLPWAPLIYNGLVCFGLCSWLELHGLRSIHASTATLVYTTIPVWGAFLSFFAHHETPAESAFIGGLVIMVTSIYAQLTTTDVDIPLLQGNKSKVSTFTDSNLEPSNEVHGSKVSRSDCITPAKDEPTLGNKRTEHHDYHPGALLTSQLKFPYYAAQAKRLLADVKIKLGALKSILLTTVSSKILTSTPSGTPTSSSPGVNPASGTSSTGAPSPNLQAISLPSSSSSASSTINSVSSHIAKVDVAGVQHVVPHGPVDMIVTPISPPSSELVSEALKATHSSDLTSLVFSVGTHTLAAITTGLESALVAVGSHIMLGCEEAEDAATLLERLVQVAVENGTHTVAACLSGGVSWLGSTSSNFVESAVTIPHELASKGESIILPFPSDVPEVVTDALVQNLLPLLNHIQ